MNLLQIDLDTGPDEKDLQNRLAALTARIDQLYRFYENPYKQLLDIRGIALHFRVQIPHGFDLVYTEHSWGNPQQFNSPNFYDAEGRSPFTRKYYWTLEYIRAMVQSWNAYGHITLPPHTAENPSHV